MIKVSTRIFIIIILGLACLAALLSGSLLATTTDTQVTVTVLGLKYITLTPDNPTVTLVPGNTPTLQFTATATYSDDTTADVTDSASWTSTNTGVATIGSNTGLATILAAGSSEISASFGDTANITTLTVVNDTSSGGGSGGGGGDGGGGGGVTGEKRITPLMSITSQEFRLLEDVEALSVDIQAILLIKKDTVVKNKVDQFLSSISVETLVIPPDKAQYTEFIGNAYNIGPEGSRFEPPALLILKYSEEAIPTGIKEKNLYIATWNEVNQEWQKIACTVDPARDMVTGNLDHLSIYATMADTRPANLELSNLIISPAEAGIGKNVTVSVLVTNTGDLPGSQAVTLKMDDEVKQTQTVTVEGQESQNIVFTVSSDVTGSHTIAINSLSGTFTVKEGTVATSAPEPTPTSTAAPASTPTSAPPAPPSLTPTTLTSNPPPVSSLPTTPASSQEPALKPTNRLILVGLIAAVVAIIGLVFGLRWWRRRSARREAFLTQNGRRYNGRKV